MFAVKLLNYNCWITIVIVKLITNTKHSANVVLMSTHRLRRWTNIKQHWLNVQGYRLPAVNQIFINHVGFVFIDHNNSSTLL